MTAPRRIVRRFPAAWGLVGDGHLLTAFPPLAVLLPILVAAGAFAVGAGRIGYVDVYTESVLLLAVGVGIGCFSTQLGAIALGSFVIGEFLVGFPSWSLERDFGRLGELFSTGLAGNLARVRLPLLITYLLLAVAMLVVPRTARSLVVALGRWRRLPAGLTWAVASGLYVGVIWVGIRTWAAAAPTLVRPRFTWLGGSSAPTATAIQPLQNDAGMLLAAAVAAALLRQLVVGLSMLPGPLRTAARAAEAAAGSEEYPRPTTTPRRRLAGDLLAATVATLTLAGVLERRWLWAVAFGVLLLVRLLRSEVVAGTAVRAWKVRTARLPAAVRLVALWILARVVTDALSTGVIRSYTGMALFVLAGVLGVFIVFPGTPPPRRSASPARPA